MKYLFLSSSFNRWAGPNNHLLDLCNYLYRYLQIDMKLLTHNTIFEPTFEKNIFFPVLKELSGAKSTILSRVTYALSNIQTLKKIIDTTVPETIFVNASIDTLLQTFLASNHRIKTGYNVFLRKPGTFFNDFSDKIMASLAVEDILAHSNFQKSMYIKIGIPEEKITIIPHCIDYTRIKNSSKKPKSNVVEEKIQNPTIFYSGRLIVEKGIKELLAAYEKVCNEVPSTLLINGNGPLREWIIQQKILIERRCKNAKIIVLPWQSVENFLYQLSNCTIFVLPSYIEQFGIVLLEAMSLEKPIITTRFGGPSEIIRNHKDGLLIDPKKDNELSIALLKLLNNKKMRDELGFKARQKIQKKYDVSVVAPQFVKFMNKEK